LSPQKYPPNWLRKPVAVPTEHAIQVWRHFQIRILGTFCIEFHFPALLGTISVFIFDQYMSVDFESGWEFLWQLIPLLIIRNRLIMSCHATQTVIERPQVLTSRHIHIRNRIMTNLTVVPRGSGKSPGWTRHRCRWQAITHFWRPRGTSVYRCYCERSMCQPIKVVCSVKLLVYLQQVSRWQPAFPSGEWAVIGMEWRVNASA
jgi:hypothetical protein